MLQKLTCTRIQPRHWLLRSLRAVARVVPNRIVLLPFDSPDPHY